MVPMLWHSAETPNPGTMAWSAHGLVRPDSRRQNLIFFTNRNILHTLKKEPLNIMLLHTSRTMDGPWIKKVLVVSRIFDISSSTGLGIEGYLTCWKDELGNHNLGMKIKICSNWEFWGLNNKHSTSCHCPLLLANGSYSLALGRDTNPGTMASSVHTQEGKI